MKLLVDNQLPEALARHLAASGVECLHVRDLGLGAATDLEIWNRAKTGGYGIVSMDDDFQHLAARYGTPPQVIWVRLGNVRKAVLIAAFSSVLPALIAGLENGTPVIEIA